MPTVLRREGFEIRIYTNDHEPAHVHVIKAGGEMKVDLGSESRPPAIVEIVGMSRKDARSAIALVEELQNYLLAKWRGIHE